MRITLLLLLFSFLMMSCRTTETLNTDGYKPSDISADSLLSSMPNHGRSLNAIKGSGRAVISEPGNNDRVRIDFKANNEFSYLDISNRLGIGAGQVLADRDSITTWNRIDKIAEKFSIYDSRYSNMNELASVNLLDLISYKVDPVMVRKVSENAQNYRLELADGTGVFLRKDDLSVWQVRKPEYSSAPYALIEYESYSRIDGFELPRRITIISADRESRVAFLVSALEINPNTVHFELDIPSDVTIIRL